MFTRQKFQPFTSLEPGTFGPALHKARTRNERTARAPKELPQLAFTRPKHLKAGHRKLTLQTTAFCSRIQAHNLSVKAFLKPLTQKAVSGFFRNLNCSFFPVGRLRCRGRRLLLNLYDIMWQSSITMICRADMSGAPRLRLTSNSSSTGRAFCSRSRLTELTSLRRW